MPEWYRKNIEETLADLKTDLSYGLTTDEAAKRLTEYGGNELQEKKGRTVWEMLWSQFTDFLVLLLIAAAVISFILGEATDAIVILIVILVNAVTGVIQEFKAEKSLAALKTLSAPNAKVVRDGKTKQIPARTLVPGDVIILEAGDFIPAEVRLCETVNLKVDESALTGESVPVEKDAHFLAVDAIPLAERKNLLFMGTVVTFGRARAVVIATGMKTEIGKIAGLIQETEAEKTPLQKHLAVFGRQLGLIAVFLCLLIFFLGVLRGNQIGEMFLTSVSLAVAAIPEGLPAIVTIVLALGVQRMAAQRAIIRKLPAVETLGSATVICSDKTGTLTQNAMTVRRVITSRGSYEVTGEGFSTEGEFRQEGRTVSPKDEPYLEAIIKVGMLANDARLSQGGEEDEARVIGDPTEGALVVVAEKAALVKQTLEDQFPRVKEYPFDSDRKRMSTVHHGQLFPELKSFPAKEDWILVKGAPDLVLERCTHFLGEDQVEELTAEQRERFLEINHSMAGEALRVLGFAVRAFGRDEFSAEPDEAERDLIFIGFMGMIDPPRPETAEAIKVCKNAGIKVKMITGDHVETALAIAKELGLAAGADQVMTGRELEATSQKKLVKSVNKISVFARVSPEHKVRIVEALKANGEIVAMTGDGVNDAPALKRADIGAAMGQTGTDVAKEAAEMVLADDNFVTVVRAVKEGRIIYENIKKSVYFLLSCNLGEVMTIMAALILRWPVPLAAIQILWINLVTDSLPALALGVDPPEEDVMSRPPRNPHAGIFNRRVAVMITGYGLFIAAITLIAYRLGSAKTIPIGETMAFATLGLSQLFHVFNFRSLHKSIFTRGIFGNKALIFAVLSSFLLQLVVLFVPFFMGVFKVEKLAFIDFEAIFLLIISPILFGEVVKVIFRAKKR